MSFIASIKTLEITKLVRHNQTKWLHFFAMTLNQAKMNPSAASFSCSDTNLTKIEIDFFFLLSVKTQTNIKKNDLLQTFVIQESLNSWLKQR